MSMRLGVGGAVVHGRPGALEDVVALEDALAVPGVLWAGQALDLPDKG